MRLAGLPLLMAAAAAADRCSVQTRRTIVPGKTISVWNGTGPEDFPEGVPSEPEFPGGAPFFTKQLDSGLLCFTGAATGKLNPKSACRCSQEYEAYANALVRARGNGFFSDADADLEALAALSAAAAECAARETMVKPPSVFPSEAAFRAAEQTAAETGTPISNSSLGPFNVRARVCNQPEIDVTNRGREEHLIAPWEFNNLGSAAAACTCPTSVEFISENFAPSAAEVSGYTTFLEENLKESAKGANAEIDFGTCSILRAGYGWTGSGKPYLPIDGSGVPVVDVDPTETEIPVYPGATEEVECGGLENPEERINFCLYGILETVDVLEIAVENVQELAAFCAAGEEGARFTQCCMGARVWTDGEDLPEQTTMIRRDLLVALQCRSSLYALNSGTGRYHTPPTGPFDDATLRGAQASGNAEGTFMPDVSADSLGKIRNSYIDSGYSDVCIPPGSQDPVCVPFEPYDTERDVDMATTVLNEKGGAPSCTPKGTSSFDDAAEFFSSTKAGQLASLRRAAFPWNSCIMPPVYASSGKPVRTKLSVAEVLRHTMTLPQKYTDTSYGWTDADFDEAHIEDVPLLVQAWYDVVRYYSTDPEKFDSESDPSAILKWWASQPPEFYIAASSVPAAIADWFTTEQNMCLKDVPGRGSSADGVQGPSVGDSRAPDQDATCSTRSCCGNLPVPANVTDESSLCSELCRVGNDPLEVVTSKFGLGEIRTLLKSCLDYGQNKFPNNGLDGDPNNGQRWCTLAGQYVKENIVWKEKYPLERVSVFADTSQIYCTSEASGRVLLRDADPDANLPQEIVFLTTAPRTTGAPVHPIFQFSGFIADDGNSRASDSVNWNYTAGPRAWRETPAYVEPAERQTRYADGAEAPSVPVQTRIQADPASGSAWYDGVELSLIVDESCMTKNHREAVHTNTGELILRIPGLYPRWIDFQQGGTPFAPDIDSCLTFDNGFDSNLLASDSIQAISNWQTAADRFSVDLYNVGGGQAPVRKAIGNFVKAHTEGYGSGGGGAPTAQENSPQYPTLGTCGTEAPARCNGMCDLSAYEADIGKSIGLSIGAVLGTIVFPELLGPETAEVEVAGEVEEGAEAAEGEAAAEGEEPAPPPPPPEGKTTVKVEVQGSKVKNYARTIATRSSQAAGVVAGKFAGDNIMAAESSQTAGGSSAFSIIKDGVRGLFHARLKVKKPERSNDGTLRYVLMTPFVRKGRLENLYANFPSMIRACTTAGEGCIETPNATDGAFGDPADTDWKGAFGSGDKWYVTGAGRASADSFRTNVKEKDQNNCDKLHIGVGADYAKTPWWNGKTAMLETTSIGAALGCHTAAAGSGSFKQNGQIPADFGLRTFGYIDENTGGSMTFQTASVPTFADFLKADDGTPRLYTAIDKGTGDTFDVRAKLGPQTLCGLCAGIGAASVTSLGRKECKMDGRRIRYDLEDSLGVFDPEANRFFTGTGIYTERIHNVSRVCFDYYDALANSSVCVDAATATGDSDLERLIGVNLRSGLELRDRAVKNPACFGNLHAASAPSCDIDFGLFHRAEDSPACHAPKIRYNSSCISPRWSNDERLVFPETVPSTAVPPPDGFDYDFRAERVSYCANGPWNFSTPEWYQMPETRPDGRVLSEHDPDSLAYVYCSSDRRTPASRHKLCRGSRDAGRGEGYITVFGLRLGIRTKINQVCTARADGVQACLFYPGETSGGFPTIQSIIDAFPDAATTALEITVVPIGFRTIAAALLAYMADVSTIYFNDPKLAGPSAYTESANGGILGRIVNVSWAESGVLAPGLCHSAGTPAFYATLYAAIERFRIAGTQNFRFPNLDKEQGAPVPDSTVYPVHSEPQITFGLRTGTIKSAFTASVASSASKLLGRTLKARNARFGGRADRSGCGRILIEQEQTVLDGLTFEQGGDCTAVPESERVPVIVDGQSAAASEVRRCTCVDCPAGIVQARGGAPTAETPAANVDVRGLFVGWPTFLWNASGCAPGSSVTECKNASLPGTETAFARTVGDPVVARCSQTEVPADKFCSVLGSQTARYVAASQTEGGPIATRTRRTTACSDACAEIPWSFDPPCCEAEIDPTVYRCAAGAYVRTAASGECSPVNCLWNRASVPPPWANVEGVSQPATISPEVCKVFYRVCAPGQCAVESIMEAGCADKTPGTVDPPCALATRTKFVDGTVISGTAPAPAPGTGAPRCSALGCRSGGFPCVPSPGLDTLRQQWFAATGDDGLPVAPIGSPAIPKLAISAPLVLDPADFAGGTAFAFIDTLQSDPGTGIYSALISVGPAGCLTRPRSLTEAGTETGGMVTVAPCDPTDRFQTFLLVYHPDLTAWRIQIVDDPFLCLTESSGDDIHSGDLGGLLVMPCAPCDVGYAVSGTEAAAVVSSILDPPSIKFDTDPGIANTVSLPLSTADPELRLIVSLETGLCVRIEPPLTGFLGAVAPQAPPEFVPCSTLEGTPLRQLEEAGVDCAAAIGMLVAPCTAATGGLSVVDGTPAALGAACTVMGGEPTDVSSDTGSGAVIRCTGGPQQLILIVASGSGFRDGQTLTVGTGTTGLVGYVSKMIWQPHDSAGIGSQPLVGPTTEVLNVSALFQQYGGDGALYTVFAASIDSATGAYVMIGLEITVIVATVAVHVYYWAKFKKETPP